MIDRAKELIRELNRIKIELRMIRDKRLAALKRGSIHKDTL